MPVIQFSRLGKMGRFGNMCFQHAFLQTYALRMGATVQAPPWIGNELFGAVSEPIGQKLPEWLEHADCLVQASPPEGAAAVDHDFVGYGQYHSSWYAPDKDFIRSLFEPTPETRAKTASAEAELEACPGLRVGVHVRRGDFGRLIFYLTPLAWYLKLLDELWPQLYKSTMFIATDDLTVLDEFSRFSPKTARSLGVERPDVYADFLLLSQCDIIIAPNSTFSFFAAMLNPHLKAFYRSSLRIQGFVQEDPWDAYPTQHDRVEDFRHVPGIELKENREW